MIRIGELLRRSKTAVAVEDGVTYRQVTIRTKYRGVVLRGSKDGTEIGTKRQFSIAAGQFLMSRIDARNGAFGIVPEELEGAIVTNDFWAFDVNEAEVDLEFFNAFLQSPQFLEACTKASRGNTNRKRVNEEFFLGYKVELPPVPEQRRIIRRVAHCRTKASEIEVELARFRTSLGLLRRAIMVAAAEGTLTAGWRESAEHAVGPDELLERVADEKERRLAAGTLRRGRVVRDDREPEDRFPIPDSWVWTDLRSIMICRDAERVPVSRAQRKVREGEFPYYGASGVIDGIDGYTHDGEFLLIGEDGSNLRLRSTPIAFPAAGKIWVNNHAHVLEFLHPVIQEYVSYRINGMDISEFVTGGFQPKLSQGNLNRISVPLPPLAEQKEIVIRVRELLAVCDELDLQLDDAERRVSALHRAAIRETAGA